MSPIKKLQELLPPKSHRGIQKICGFLNWFRPFIPSLSSKLKPISDKLRKNEKFI